MNLPQLFHHFRSRNNARQDRATHPTGLADLTEAEVVAELFARNDDPSADSMERTGALERFPRSKEGA